MSNKGVISNINLNNNSSYSIASTATAICSTAANTQNKSATLVNSSVGTNFNLIDGVTVNILFENENEALNPTLNVHNSGYCSIHKFDQTDSNITWKAGAVLTLTYFANIGGGSWWINGNDKDQELIEELYKITVTKNNTTYISNKSYEEILEAYNSNKYIYVFYDDQQDYDNILPLTWVDKSGYYFKFNFEILKLETYFHFAIFGADGHDPDNPIDTVVSYEFAYLAYSEHSHGNITNTGDITSNVQIASGDRLVINDESASKLVNSSITFGSSSSQYLANNGTWQNIPNNADDISYIPYDQHDWPYGDPQDVTEALDDLAARKTGTSDVQIDSTSIVSSGVANIITSSSHPYNASTNPLATMGDISADKIYIVYVLYDEIGDYWYTDKSFDQIAAAYNDGKFIYALQNFYDDRSQGEVILTAYSYYLGALYLDDRYLVFTCLDEANIIKSFELNGNNNNSNIVEIEQVTRVTDVKINNTSIRNGSIVNINTGTTYPYNASTNPLATMSDIPTFSGVNDVKIDNSTIVSSGVANITTSASHPYSSNNPLATIGDISAAGGGTVTSITAGTGLTGGTITSSGTISLSTSGVTAGTYQGLTVDTYGRVTSASNQNYLTSYTETDPTVPSWAKANTKPDYGAYEISYQPQDQTWEVTNVDGALNSLYSGKVNAVSGKGLSTEDYTTAEKNKLSGIATGAEVNVQSNWNETSSSSDAYIQNKPTKLSDFTNDSGFTTNTGTVIKVTAGAGLTTTSNSATDGGDITSSGTLYLTKSGVTAGTYQGITVDSYGRVTSATNKGYTSNTGTITGITMNGSSKGTSGVVDLGTVLTSYTETDPTVPSWAKASSKPTYTASEVGALSSTVPVNIGDSLYLRGTGLWRSTDTANKDRIITTVNSGKDLMINADSTKTDANTGTIFLGYTNTTAVNIGTSSSDVALNYNGSAVFSNSYTSPSVYSSRCTITNGGYMQIGKWIIVNLYITIDTTLNANTNSLLIYDLPEPGFSMSLSASATAPGTVKGLNSFIRKHTTSGATKGEICICSTSGLASGNVVLISGIYTVS